VLTVFGAATISAAPSSTSAAPNKTPKNPYNVSIGQNTLWTGAQCNVHQAGTWGTIGSATVAQSSKGSTITTTATSPYEPTSGSGGSNYALVGVGFNITGISTQAQWQAVRLKPVVVTVHVGYGLTSNGVSGYSSTKLDTSTNGIDASSGWGEPIAAVMSTAGQPSGTVSSTLTTVKLNTTLAGLSSTNSYPGNLIITVQIPQNEANSNPGPTQTTAVVTVYDIQLQWS
jgi:hypothetical protein